MPELLDYSTYSTIFAIYTRSEEYQLLSSQTSRGFEFEKHWTSIVPVVKQGENKETSKVCSFEYTVDPDSAASDMLKNYWSDLGGLIFREYQKPGETQIRGIITSNLNSDMDEELHNYYYNLILDSCRLRASEEPADFDKDYKVSEYIADIYQEEMKNYHFLDKWEQGGKEFFTSRVSYFTKRNVKIEAVLPAFPCKSSNTEKVFGVSPDRGEEMALKKLMKFCRDVRRVYEPGMKVYIVSDGHVFSDCIGVDDDVVDDYTMALRDLYANIVANEEPEPDQVIEHEDLIGFVSLKDLFFRQKGGLQLNLVKNIELPHFTGTKICEEAEFCRKLLMAGCDTDAGQLRKDIEQPNHSRLFLYRGFSKFMREDLSLNEYCQTLSNKQFKKTVSRVAFEMIKRNDAYSNLVELLFPFHLRLSIHAHDNSGPKFGVRLLAPDKCRIIEGLDSSDEPSFADLLHIPTPWHNVIVEIEGHGLVYMAKAKVVKDAINSGLYKGEWRKGNLAKGQGGYFHLTKVL